MDIDKILVSSFCNIREIHNPTNLPLTDFLDSVKSPSQHLQSIVTQIRNAKTKEDKNRYKLLLPALCPSGTFSERNDSSLISYSQVMCIDLDHVHDSYKVRAEMKDCENVLSVFDSPSGQGLKVLVLHDLSDTKYHSSLYEHLGNYLGLSGRTDLVLDTSCRNLSHGCFYTMDKNIYINQHAIQFHVDTSILSTPPSSASSTGKAVIPTGETSFPDPLTDRGEIRKRLKESHELFERYHSLYPGTRNNGLFVLAMFFREDGIPEQIAEDYLVAYYVDTKGFNASEIRSTVQSAYK
ncbi:MAG: hypothetical protein MJY88_09500 [Bacteroidales bacterium]|nr:hypothetical protein [Bacteroidales bacterium]